ncbi:MULTISPECIES: hypothetical protein [Rhodopseudomonas]|uniref:Transmembrane protein n=1 Tax=Rhodopseudomonas palustris TaxID=1076 RepID=A0A0D7EEU2_RHOPL|nr:MULTISPECIES: hypothetical protein [Rhodopseudomonas]KIZ39233.1 hypothetical protein OO17_21035 [Rhodopseudomonas palustris]MDF3813197.1 hypothetical protein [Rhodopseudomonas sp. BAL398]WOK17815.1 hypothetical protein RBJ75_27495 [Rhodopseudomonas sp. BAL398]
MQYWIIAFTAALVVVIGYAAGPVGAVASLVVFSSALYLLWARRLGFNGAWTRFGLDRLTAPLWKGENWDRFGMIFNDRDTVVKAATVAVVLIALSLLLPPNQVALVALAIAIWFAVEIYRGQRSIVRPTTAIESKVSNDKVLYTPPPAARPESSAKIN